MDFRPLVLQCLSAFPAVFIATHAIAQDYHWVQLGPQGFEARAIVGNAADCPVATIDGAAKARTAAHGGSVTSQASSRAIGGQRATAPIIMLR